MCGDMANWLGLTCITSLAVDLGIKYMMEFTTTQNWMY